VARARRGSGIFWGRFCLGMFNISLDHAINHAMKMFIEMTSRRCHGTGRQNTLIIIILIIVRLAAMTRSTPTSTPTTTTTIATITKSTRNRATTFMTGTTITGIGLGILIVADVNLLL
jgi:hypothetical protein